MKPLYLDSRVPLDARLDGPSLSVARGGHVTARYPLRQLSRIIVCGPVNWQTEALLACAEAGIGVHFIARSGRLRAMLHGAPGKRGEIAQRLADFLIRADWCECFDCWADATARNAARDTALRLRLRHRAGSREEAIEALWFGATAGHSDRATVQRLDRQLQGLLRAHIAAVLVEFGLGEYLQVAPDFRPDLLKALTRIVRWRLRRSLHGQLRQLARDPQPGLSARLVRLYESRSARVEIQIRMVLNGFHAWLIEEN